MVINFPSYFLIIDTESVMRCISLLCLTSHLACIKPLKAHHNKWVFMTLCLGRERKGVRYRQLHIAAVWFAWWQRHVTLASSCVCRERSKGCSVCVALQRVPVCPPVAQPLLCSWHGASCSSLTVPSFIAVLLAKASLCASLPYTSNYSLLWFAL